MRKAHWTVWAALFSLAAGCEDTRSASNPLLRVDPLPSGEECPYGGSVIVAGRDADGDGVLDEAEIDEASFVCSGADGSVGPQGPVGPSGPSGPTGPQGDAGTDATNVLLTIRTEPSGGACASGGVRVDTGLDLDRDGVLDATEITDTEYVCASAPPNVVGFELVGRYSAPTGPAAEIVVATPDGKRVVFSNGIENSVGVLDIEDPSAPSLVASISVRDVVAHAQRGAVTSVAVTPNGRYAIAAVLDSNDPTASDAGTLAFIDLTNLAAGVVGQVSLGVGPDSVHITPDGLRAVVAIEDEGPSLRAGSIQIITIDYANPSASVVKTLAVAPTVGNNLSDVQPEYVDISPDGTRAIVSLQENNLVAVVDLTRDEIIRYIDLGTVMHTADVTANATIDFSAPFMGRREADTVCFLADGQHFVTANEGDTSASAGVFSGGRGFSVFDLDGSLVYDSGDTVERFVIPFGQYQDSRSSARGIEVEGCATGVYGHRQLAFLLGERNSSVIVASIDDPAAPALLQVLPAPFRPEGAIAIPARNLVVVAGEGPNGGDPTDAMLGGGVWLYRGVLDARDVRAMPANVLQAHSATLPFGAISGGSWNGVDGQMIVTPDVAVNRQRIWTFEENAAHTGVELVQELLLTDTAGAPLTGYDPEGLAVNPEGGYVLATEGTGANGGSAAGQCNGTDKLRNRLLFVNAAGQLDASRGGGDGIVDLPCAATSEPNGLDWTRITGNGFEGVSVVDADPSAAGGLKVYAILQRPLSGSVDPARITRLGEYDVDTSTWRWFFYELEPDLAGVRNAVVLSELTHIGGDEFAVIERDQRRTGSASIKRIYRFHLSTGTPGVPSDPVDKVLAVDLLHTPFRFDFEKVESIILTPRGTYVVNDNDGGDEAVFFYRLVLPGQTPTPAPDDAGMSMDAGMSIDAAMPLLPIRINEVQSTSSEMPPVADGVELYNPNGVDVDISGYTLTDSGNAPFTIPAGTIVPQLGYLVLREDAPGSFPFGLGGADSVALHDPSTVLVDSISWSTHVQSLGRCANGAGAFVSMALSFGSANICP